MRPTLTTYGGKLLGSLTARAGAGSSARASAVPDPLPADEFELIVVDAGKLWISRRDEVMRPYMARAGSWEPEEGHLLLSLTKPGTRFLDIGANVGYFSVLVNSAAPGVIVDAVEPDPTNVRVLRFNFWVNEVQATVWPLALDDRSRSLHLSDNEHNLGDLRTGHVEDRDPLNTPKWVVPAASGDELLAGKSFDLVKIDTQGWEFEILLGLDLTLRRSAGVRIVAEFSLRSSGTVVVSHSKSWPAITSWDTQLRAVIHGEPTDLVDAEIMQVCLSGGREGQVNLLLSR